MEQKTKNQIIPSEMGTQITPQEFHKLKSLFLDIKVSSYF